MSTAIAKNLMAEMKLLGMFAAYDQAITDATRDQIGYSEFLDTLLQAETDYRQERKTGCRIKSAKFTLRPAFEDIDFTASRSISKAQIKELYSLAVAERRTARTVDRPNRCGQDLPRTGHRIAYVRVRPLRVVHDGHNLVGECRTRPIQRHLLTLPRQGRQTRRTDFGRHGDA